MPAKLSHIIHALVKMGWPLYLAALKILLCSKALSKKDLTEMSQMICSLKKTYAINLREQHRLYITKCLWIRQLIAIPAARSTPPNRLQSHDALLVCAEPLSSFSASVLHVKNILVHVLQALLAQSLCQSC